MNFYLYCLYNKCVVADLEPQLQAFCRKAWNCMDFFREVARKKKTESEKDKERETETERERER